MQQLDDLMNKLERARACEKAAAMDVCDRADDHRLTKSRLAISLVDRSIFISAQSFSSIGVRVG